MSPSSSASETLIPVTLLSGFLGSGKTTLLQHILHTKDHKLRVAVIVNDMGAINIDANLVAKSGVLQRNEQLVRLENGCICCTLRVDLLEEIAKIAEAGEVDYIIIESSGISEPMQVAETFAFELPPHDESDGSKNSHEHLPLLKDIARLDTCVTVVDASNFFHVFEDPRMLMQLEEHRDELPEQDTRTLTDLLVDQLEFADVVIINKTDLAPVREVDAIDRVVRKFNPQARILRATNGRIDPKEILGTQLFSFERAQANEGWLESLTTPHVPETVEYGIASFLYSARRPFHPHRLCELIQTSFVIVESPELPPPQMDDEHEDEEEEEEVVEEDTDDADAEDDDEAMEDAVQPLDDATVKERLRGKQQGVFKNLLRSKGVFWLATRPKNYGTWSQAGLYCTMANGGMWIADYPEKRRTRSMKELPNYDELMALEFGDRGQEIVFIGRFGAGTGEIDAIRSALDRCLLSDEELASYRELDVEDWEDPFEPWSFYEFDDDADMEL
ncbi:hypothetical protein ATCC90586_008992 [Pythium insidiosum]|nr:hypothetical protein ATCC90586_008992 [Pythium insidiosum]